MSGLVVDVSVVMSRLFDEEGDPRADMALERLKDEGAVVPNLWHLEARNALLAAERRGRLSAGAVDEGLDALKGLPIRTDQEPDLQSPLNLARPRDLPFYRALYLELAKREGSELATLDGALGRAAAAGGVPLSAG